MQKRIAVLACLTVLAAWGLAAQVSKAAYQKAGLSDEEATKVDAVYQRLVAELAKGKADLKLAEAGAERLLVEAQPDMAKVEKALREGYEAQLRMRLARIKAEVEIRGIVGDKKWLILRRFIRAQEAAVLSGKEPAVLDKEDIRKKEAAALEKAKALKKAAEARRRRLAPPAAKKGK